MRPTTKTKQPIRKFTPEELDRLAQFFEILMEIDCEKGITKEGKRIKRLREKGAKEQAKTLEERKRELDIKYHYHPSTKP